MIDSMIEAEATDLKTHVQLCSQRHDEITKRLGRLEKALWAAALAGATAAGTGIAVLKDLAPIAAAMAAH